MKLTLKQALKEYKPNRMGNVYIGDWMWNKYNCRAIHAKTGRTHLWTLPELLIEQNLVMDWQEEFFHTQ